MLPMSKYKNQVPTTYRNGPKRTETDRNGPIITL